MIPPPSIVRIQSKEPGNTALGTGFIIYKTDTHSYILTCAHVVRDVGGPTQVTAGKQPAEVVAIGEHDGLDLTVLRVAHFMDRTPLRLSTSGQSGQVVSIQGYSKYSQYQRLKVLNGRTTEESRLCDTSEQHYVYVWDIVIEDEQKLLGGYSGSPVCVADGAVIGVMITREGEQQGQAISIEALRTIWPKMPVGLLQDAAAPEVPEPSNHQNQPVELDTLVPDHVSDLITNYKPILADRGDVAMEPDHVSDLITNYKRRLHKLEIQQAQKGISTEPHIIIEIEDLRKKIADCEAQRTSIQSLEVELLAFPTATPSDSAAESLDWRHYYAQATPTPDLWQARLIPDLLALKQRLKRRRVTTLLLDSDTRLSAALAFGYAFRQPTGFQLRVNQYGDIWTTETQDRVAAPLTRPEIEPLAGGGSDITIEMSSARQNIHPDVKTWLDAHPGLIARRVRLAVSVEKLDGPMSIAIARAIFQLMHDQRRTPPAPQTIHFFAAMPKGLAVLIGWHLHTCGPVQFYEKLGTSYQISCLLDERW